MSTPAGALQDPSVASSPGRELAIDVTLTAIAVSVTLLTLAQDDGPLDGVFRVEAELPVRPEVP